MGKKKNGGCADAIAFISANYKVWYKMVDEMYEKVCYLINNARDNDGEAQYWIAKANLENIGINGNPNNAFVAAQKAVNAGYTKGYYILGKCYKNGKGCLKDKEKAKEYFHKGMMLGDAECTDALKSMERNKKLFAGGAIFGKALLNIGKAVAESGALDPEGFDQIDDDAEYYDDDDYE
ncbi:MAG TPA: sel1 repeat family protein [Ruminococcus sp.]|nr:putative uncharacterized protein [Ruminococcus sp. CAG:624]